MDTAGVYGVMTSQYYQMRARLFVRFSAFVLIGLCCLFTLSGCDEIQGYSSYKALRGVIVNADTGEPIPDAIVVAEWITSTGTAGGSELVCFNTESTVTNASGEYYIPSWSKKSPFRAKSDDDIMIYAHKPGYRWPYPKIAYGIYPTNKLVVSRDRAADRLEYLQEVARQSSCFRATLDGYAYPMLPLAMALLEEAQGIAQSDDDPIVEFIREKLEEIKFGYTEASRRSDERVASYRWKHNPARKALQSNVLVDLEYVIQTGLTDPNDRLEYGDTLLMIAAGDGDVRKVAYLLKSGADPATRNPLSATKTALDKAVDKLSYKNSKEGSGYIEIIKMLAAAKGVDTTSLRSLAYSRDPVIHALADFNPAADSMPDIAKEPIEPLTILSQRIDLKPGVETHLQFTVQDGRIKSIRETNKLPPDGELLSLKLLGPDKTGHSKLELRTRLHGRIYMRVILEGGNGSALPVQDYLIRGPNGFESWTIEHDWKKITITDFYMHYWSNEPPEYRMGVIEAIDLQVAPAPQDEVLRAKPIQ